MRRKGLQSKTPKELRLSLFAMLLMLALIPLILSIAMISFISLRMTQSNLENSAKNTLYIAANNLANYCYQNEINAMNVGNYYEYLDSLQERSIEMAIILEGTPSATSIKNENDYRIREIPCRKDIEADREELEDGYFDEEVTIDDKVYYAYYMPIRDGGEIIGMAFAGELKESVTGKIDEAASAFLKWAALPIVLFAIVILFFSRGLSKAFEAAGRSVNALAEGDLSRQKEQKSAVLEMNTLLNRTKLMQENLAQTIGGVKEVSQRLVENIAQAALLNESSCGRTRQITSAMEKLSASSVDMTENIHGISGQMEEIGGSVNEMYGNVEHLFDSSQTIRETNEEAKNDMSVIIGNSKTSVAGVLDISEQIKQTNDSIAEIEKAVALILDISGRTRLLSLNAAIEAANAGEHGRGFAVVAGEVGKLSALSAQGAESIKNLAGIITGKSHRSVELADRVLRLITQEQESIARMQQKFEGLSRDITQTVEDVAAIAEKTRQLTDYKERVIGNVRRLSAIGEENAANNQEVNVNVEQIMSEIQTVNESCARMNSLAGELETSVSYFHN